VLRRDGVVIWCSPSGEATELDFTERYVLETGRLRQR
jgi:hypothetical protein